MKSLRSARRKHKKRKVRIRRKRPERADEIGNGVTEVTLLLENTRFSPFFDFADAQKKMY